MKTGRILRAVALTGMACAMMGGASLAQIRQHTRAPPLDAAEPPQVTVPIIGIVTPKPGSWNPLGFVNVARFPFDGTPESANKKIVLGMTTKTFFRSGVYYNFLTEIGRASCRERV